MIVGNGGNCHGKPLANPCVNGENRRNTFDDDDINKFLQTLNQHQSINDICRFNEG